MQSVVGEALAFCGGRIMRLSGKDSAHCFVLRKWVLLKPELYYSCQIVKDKALVV